MSNRAKHFVLILALAVLPLQGMAAAFSSIVCHDGLGDPVATVTHAGGGHGHGAEHHSPSDDGQESGVDHASCHPLTPVLPVVSLPATAADFPVWAPASHALPDLFIPDRPQRPPLA